MNVFVERSLAGAIVGIYSMKQPGYAEEEIPETHPDVVAFRSAVVAPARDVFAEIDAIKAKLARASAVEAVLIDKGTVTAAAIDAKRDVIVDAEIAVKG